ncbi:MAG: metallophosphoesterase [Actinomycetota bacterium]
MARRVVQLSDTHFLEAGSAPEGGFAYDTVAAFDALLPHIRSLAPDLVAVTGDVADHGRLEQYRVAAEAFERIGRPVNLCPGNHDQHAAFTSVARPTLATSRVVHSDNWCHLFVDSNAGALTVGPDGELSDPEDYDDRLHINGVLGEREARWIHEQAELTDADHLFIWCHHPPAPTAGISADEAYEAEWRSLLPEIANLRGIAAGHTHVPGEYELLGVPVFMAPALKNNFDIEARTLLPPGFRSFDFRDDGSVTSELHFADGPEWPRAPYGRAVHALMTGELSWQEFNAIVARKAASG